MNNIDLKDRLQYIFLEEDLSWQQFATKAGAREEKRFRGALLSLLDNTNDLLSHIGYHIEIVKNP